MMDRIFFPEHKDKPDQANETKQRIEPGKQRLESDMAQQEAYGQHHQQDNPEAKPAVLLDLQTKSVSIGEESSKNFSVNNKQKQHLPYTAYMIQNASHGNVKLGYIRHFC